MTRTIRELATRTDAATAAEFAIVLPVLLLFLLGIIDVGRYMWAVNQLEKATQIGVRTAVVTDMVATDLGNLNYGLTLGQGAKIPTSVFGAMHCDKFSGSLRCVCNTGSVCTGIGMTGNATAFKRITDEMIQVAPDLTDTHVRITYANSGLGYAGDPNGPDVAPIVTVSTSNNISFIPMAFQLFGGSTTLPSEQASMTLEDASGTTSN